MFLKNTPPPPSPPFVCVCIHVHMSVCVPVFSVLDALAQRGSLSQRRVPTATGTGGQDAILRGTREQNKNV